MPDRTASLDDEAHEPLGKGAQTRQAVLQAAIDRFGRDGFRATKIADVARDAGVGPTVTYAYFPNKEALFEAALDEDAAGAISEAAAMTAERMQAGDLSIAVVLGMVDAVERHPLARRVLAGLEPHATARLLELPALEELRKFITEQLRHNQTIGLARTDIDPAVIANGILSIMLSMLMSVLQFGVEEAAPYAVDVLAVFEAATGPVGPLSTPEPPGPAPG